MTSKRPKQLRGTPRLNSRRIIKGIVENVADPVSLGLLAQVDFDELDPAEARQWAAQLRASERSLRELRLRLEAVDPDAGRQCAACGRPLAGRADRRFCGATCRQRASRQSRLQA